MRIYFLFLLIIILVSCTNDAKVIKDVEYKIEEDYVEFYDNGIKKIEGVKLNGERHGVWNFYYKSGIKWSEGRYKEGKRDGYSIVYYENGKKKVQGDYKDHKRAGVWKIWNEDGTFKDQIDFDKPLTRKDSILIYTLP